MMGFLNLIKPPGMTSHDVVQQARRLMQTRAIGHTGTLDPAAAGVLVLTVGQATRLGEYVESTEKQYWAEITLGIVTDSADAEGKVIAEASAADVTREQVETALRTLTGKITMRPPAHSAVRVGGKRLYELARAGEQVEAPEREVAVYEIRLLAFVPGTRALVRIDVTCSKGTYIRSLAMMLGDRLGCGGYLSALIRTRVGAIRIEQAVTLEELAEDPQGALLGALEALPHLPVVAVEAHEIETLRHGQAVRLREMLPEGPALAVDELQRVVCLGEVQPGEDVVLQPRKVFNYGSD